MASAAVIIEAANELTGASTTEEAQVAWQIMHEHVVMLQEALGFQKEDMVGMSECNLGTGLPTASEAPAADAREKTAEKVLSNVATAIRTYTGRVRTAAAPEA